MAVKETVYKDDVAANLIKHRQNLRDVNATLNDTAAVQGTSGVLETLDTHTTDISNNTDELGTHDTRIGTVEVNLHYAPAVCVTTIAAISYNAGSTFAVSASWGTRGSRWRTARFSPLLRHGAGGPWSPRCRTSAA